MTAAIPQQEGVSSSRRGGRLAAARVSRLLVSGSSLAVLDQLLVSATRFLTTILVGRCGGADDLGMYTIAFSVVVLSICVQEALITTPYTVYASRLHGPARALYAGGAILQHGALAAASALALLATALASEYLFLAGELALVFLVLALVVPLSLTREFARRIAFAHLRMGAALLFDGATAAIQIALLVYLVSLDGLTAATAFVSLGVACLLTSAVWLTIHRGEFFFRARSMRRAWKKNWTFGRWMLGGQVMGALSGYLPSWILAVAVGTAAAGWFAACESIVLLSNPLLLGVSNFIVPRTAESFVRGGHRELSRVVAAAAVAMTAILSLLAMGLILYGAPILRALYGAAFEDYGRVVSILAICIPMWGVSHVLAGGLCALEAPQVNFAASLLSACVVLLTCAVMVPSYGPLGAGIGLLAGSFAGVCCQARAFVRLNRVALEEPVQRNEN